MSSTKYTNEQNAVFWISLSGIGAGFLAPIVTLLLVDKPPVGVFVCETAAIGLSVIAGVAYFRFNPYRSAPPAVADSASLASLRRENAENFTVLQKDVASLGAALIRRLDKILETENDDVSAFSGTVTDLAVSIAEARETLAGVAADLAEAKSVIFEMQAQLDQQADALRAFEHSVERIIPAGCAESEATGSGAPPGALGRALASAPGAAVSRLITGNARRPDEVSATEMHEHVVIAENDESVDDWLLIADEDKVESGIALVSAESRFPLMPEGSTSHHKTRRPGRDDTAVIAHVMIGIGNKPYLRGHGPGLSPDKGVPMEYVDVGRWQWIAPEAGVPVFATLWKNDEIRADGDAVEIRPGVTLEIRPHFAV